MWLVLGICSPTTGFLVLTTGVIVIRLSEKAAHYEFNIKAFFTIYRFLCVCVCVCVFDVAQLSIV